MAPILDPFLDRFSNFFHDQFQLRFDFEFHIIFYRFNYVKNRWNHCIYSIPSVFGTSKEQQNNDQTCIDFLIIFGAKITQKSIRKRYEFRYPFRTHIFPDFYRILAPSWTPKPTQDPRKNRKKKKKSIGHRIENLMKKPSVRQIWARGGSALINSHGVNA